MADSVITLKDQKFRKVKGVWVDQKKTPAPKDLIGLLDKLSAAEAATAGPDAAKESKPALPAAKDFSTAKLESSINRLAKVIEKLSKTIEKSESKKQPSKDQSAKQDTDDTDVPASPAQRISKPGKTPTLREAIISKITNFFTPNKNKPEPATRVTKETAKEVAQMKAANPELTSSKALEQIRARSVKQEAVKAVKQEAVKAVKAVNTNKIPTFGEALKLNTKDFFKGTTNKYGEKETPGLLRTIGEKSFPVIGPAIFAARDRQRAAVANQIKESGGPATSGEKERQKTLVQGKSEFASPDVDKNIVSVKITDIDESVLKKLGNIFGKKDGKESPDDKEENKPEAGSGGGGFFDKIRKRLFGGGTKQRGPAGLAAEIVKDTAGKSRYAKGAVDASGKKIGGQFVKAAAEGAENVAEAAAKKPNVLSKLFGGGTAAAEGVEQAAKKPNVLSKLFGGGAKAAEKAGAKAGAKTGAKILGKGLLKSALKKIPGVGLIAGGAFAAGRALKGDFAGAGLELASGAVGTIPGIGTAASIGIDAALAAKDMGAFGGAPPGSPAEASQGAPAVPVKPKTPSKFASVAKALGKGALMATPFGAAALGAKAIGGLLKNNKNKAEMDKPTTAAETKTLIAGEPFIPGQPMSERQRSAIKMSISMGNTPSPTIMKSYEMTKPTGVTPQTQALTSTTKQVEAAKQQRPAAGPTVINNNVSSPTNVSSSQGVIGGPTVADRGSLNLASF